MKNILTFLSGKILYALVALIAVWALFSAVKRYKAEASNDTVEICVDFNQCVDLCQANGYKLEDFLSRCQAIGVNSAAIREDTLASLSQSRKIIYYREDDFGRLNMLDLVSSGAEIGPGSILALDKNVAPSLIKQLTERYALGFKQKRVGKYRVITPVFNSDFRPTFWNENLPLGFQPDKADFLAGLNLKTVLKPQNCGNAGWLDDDYSSNISGFMWEGKDVPGYPGGEDKLASAIARSGKKFVDMEFASFTGSDKIDRALPALAVRGHQITPQELAKNFSSHAWMPRWDRAVNERGIRFLLFYFWDNKNIEDNISYLRDLAREMKSSGYKLGTALPPAYPMRGGQQLWIFFAIAAGVILPLVGLKLALKSTNPLKAYLICNGVTLAAGILISVFFFDGMLMQKLVDIPGVKTVMILPLLLSCVIIFTPAEIGRMLAFKLQLKHVLIAFAALLVLTVMLLRSGNYNALTTQPEFYMRDALENIFGFRPRTKEFLFGQPLLFLGFYFKNPYLILLGMVGQVSIINTFFHAHSTIISSVVRSFHGIWIGLAAGYAALFVVKRFTKK